MVGRVCLCILVMSALHIPWCLEQPSSSVMELHPCFQYIAKKFVVYRAAW